MISWTLFFMLLSSSAWAIKGTYADKEYELPQSCKLRFYVNMDGKTLTGTCTGSFLGNKTFSSAQHCHDSVAENLAYKIPEQAPSHPWFECPGIDRKFPIQKSFPFKTTGYSSSQDIALMKVSVDIPEAELKPMATPSSGDHIEKLLQDPTKCYINGYGLDNDGQFGVLRAANIVEWDSKPLSFFGGSSYAFKISKNYAAQGDSGGPMYCLDHDKTPVLVGVVHGGIKGMQFTTIEKFSQSVDWLNYIKSAEEPSNELFSKVFRINEHCGSVVECFNKLEEAAKLSQDMKEIIAKLVQNIEGLKQELITGKNLEVKTIDDTWEAMLEEWNNHNCYKVLYPD